MMVRVSGNHADCWAGGSLGALEMDKGSQVPIDGVKLQPKCSAISQW